MNSLSPLSHTLGYLFLAYCFLTLLFYFASNSLMYFPPKPTTFKDSPNTLKFEIDNKTTVSAIYLPRPQARVTVLLSHGNAEDLGSLEPYLNYYHAQGIAILAYDYPGYGTSTGTPTEESTYQAITAAYRYMREALKIPSQNIIVHGRSLGCGPSIYLANLYPVGGLILERAFVSAYRVETVIPLFPFDKYKNLENVRHLNTPTLVIHGTKDSIVPFWHGRMIFNALKGYKQAYWVKGAGHNDILSQAGENYWQAIKSFLKEKP